MGPAAHGYACRIMGGMASKGHATGWAWLRCRAKDVLLESALGPTGLTPVHTACRMHYHLFQGACRRLSRSDAMYCCHPLIRRPAHVQRRCDPLNAFVRRGIKLYDQACQEVNCLINVTFAWPPAPCLWLANAAIYYLFQLRLLLQSSG